MRFAFGGIHIECSTYSRIRSRSNDFTILLGEKLSAASDFAFLRSYPHPFFPTFYARAIPGGPVERTTSEAFKGEFIQPFKNSFHWTDSIYRCMARCMSTACKTPRAIGSLLPGNRRRPMPD